MAVSHSGRARSSVRPSLYTEVLHLPRTQRLALNQVRDWGCLSRGSEGHSLAEIRKRRTNHKAMNIARVHLDALRALGYTEAEARFLYLVATHSGYFVARQFLAFANAHWGERTTTF
jgi:hypothetical protein